MFQERVNYEHLDKFSRIRTLQHVCKLVDPGTNHYIEFILGITYGHLTIANRKYLASAAHCVHIFNIDFLGIHGICLSEARV